ncbi:NUDIX domain-containing protein [Candidatus Latescibacterota bacterium]
MKSELSEFRFCSVCGGNIDIVIHEGYRRPVCVSCGHVVYVNPVPAVCLVVFDGNKILFVLRAVDPKKGMWCLPGGFIEWGESVSDSAKRELFEETAVTAGELSLLGVYDSITDSHRHVLLIGYHASKWSGEPNAGDDAERVEWFNVDDIPPLAFSAHEQVIHDFFHKKGML